MKGFYFDTLLDAENICNMEREKKLLREGIAFGKKSVAYGPRNFGKTSIVKNILLPEFYKKHKKCFVLFVDLMEVKSLASIDQRVQTAFQEAFSKTFRLQNFFEEAKRLLSHFKPQISLDSLTGEPSLSFGLEASRKKIPFTEIFNLIGKKISKETATLIVLDEFQDIAFVPEAQGLFRQVLQDIGNLPVILMGSKRHILSDIFAKPKAPLASFGEDIDFHPIPYDEYHRYIQERFQTKALSLSETDAIFLQDLLYRVPESVNIVCAHLFAIHEKTAVNQAMIHDGVRAVVEKRRSRYEEFLSNLSEKEEEILVEIARMGDLKKPNGKLFLNKVRSSQRTVSLTIARFLDKSFLEKTAEGIYRLADPLLSYFLREFR